MVNHKIYEYCQSGASISAELAKDPTLAPSHVREKLFGGDHGDHIKQELFKEPHATAEELKQAAECGKWGPQQPSELFLRVSTVVYCLSDAHARGRENL